MGIKRLNLKKFVYKKIFVNTVDKISFSIFKQRMVFCLILKEIFIFKLFYPQNPCLY